MTSVVSVAKIIFKKNMAKKKLPLFEELGLSDALNFSLETCAKCGYCKPVCATFPYGGGFESHSPRSKMYYLHEVRAGREKLDKEWVDRLYRCSTCERCVEVCQTEIPIVEIWEAARAEMVKQGIGPMPNHLMFRDNVEKFNNPYGEATEERNRWIQADHNPVDGAEILIFGGCTASYKMPPMLQTGATILTKAKVPFAYAGPQEACCGSPILRTGQLEAAKRVIGMNLDTFQKMGIKRIVSPCSGCAKTLKYDYPKWGERLGKKFDIEVLHFSELYVKLIEEGKIKPSRLIEMVVTYHDPCHLGRSQSIYDEPRKILASIPGLKLVEMEYIRESAHCCGAGGGVRAQYADMANDLAMKRIKQAEETGAEAMVTMCPFCQSSFTLVKKEMGAKIKILGVEEVLLNSLE